MTTIDWIILAAYALSTIGLGWYLGRKQEDTTEYFVGSGAMNPLLIGISLFATLLSTITYLSTPGEIAGKGPAMVANFVAYPFVFLVVGFVILPVYMRQRVTSAYELLEEKLGLSIRLLGGGMFLTLRIVWMSFLIYMTSKAIATMVGIDESKVIWIAIITGVFAITYTTLGGLKAVVITDSIQTLLLYGGALLVIGTITWKMGGFSWFPTEWKENVWDTQPLYSFDPSTRVTLLGSLISVFLWMVCTSMGDQVSVQRFMSTKDAKTARKAIAMQLTVGAVVGLTLVVVGFALLGFFEANPDLIPEGGTLKEKSDLLFPTFIGNHLPPVITGLVVSGLFAAAMSSIDSGVNSITAVITTDYRDRFGKKPESEAEHLRFARILAAVIGILVIGLSTIFGNIEGNFYAVTNKVVNLLTVPIALLFFFALFVPFANAAGVWIGVICSVITAGLISFSQEIFAPEADVAPVTFQLIAPAALVVGLTVGLIACKIFSFRKSPQS